MQHKPQVSNSVLAMIMVIITEMMFFGGMISSYILAQAGQENWPPSDQPRLSFSITFINMLILIISAFFMFKYIKSVKKENSNITFLNITIALGSLFFIVQGYEWARILIFGLETSHSLFTSFFYAIIGLHGLHVFVGLIILFYVSIKTKITNDNDKNYNIIKAAGLFWYFVVILWPILYYLIYLD